MPAPGRGFREGGSGVGHVGAWFNLRDHVLLPGLLTGQDRLAALADADVLVYASEGEVFGLVPIEALHRGTPVIVLDDSACGEVVSDTGGGLLTPPGNAERLRDAMGRDTGDHRGGKKIALDARARAERYLSDHVCATIEAMYADVMAGATNART
ncbi:MAG: glycosyltransferase [Acidobacteria bacterium]|nr:glycosyltransferase [Acidobacteriota bacterium]